ncbi:MAG: phosphoribosylglycinamide formyltransferase [Alphaproteobacteria bacterium]|nr:phosphoribosylglycinamide formyltransferase [Alphaproteobacteria bacterium]
MSGKGATGSGTPKKRVVVMISGRGSNLSALISATMAPDYPCRIVAVLSDNPDAAGLDLAREYAIEADAFLANDFSNRAAHEQAIQARLDQIRPDIICLAGYMRLLSADFVNRWHGMIVNIHPSLLPSFPGLDTHKRALDHQVRIHGCSVHFVTEGMDEGPLIAQAAVPVAPDDTEASLSARVLAAEHQLYPMALRLLAEEKVRMSGTGESVFSRLSGGDDSLVISPISAAS